MRNKLAFGVFLHIMIIFTVIGCSNFSGPSEPEAVQAIMETGRFKGGVESFTLLSPIVIVDKGSRTREGFWPVKAKFTAGYTMSGGETTEPKQVTAAFKLYKSKSKSGVVTWTAR